MEPSNEGLIESIIEQDVLYVLWHLNDPQTKSDIIANKTHSTTGLTAIQTVANQTSSNSEQSILILRILLLVGADPTITSSHGTALEIARTSGNTEAYNVMLNWNVRTKEEVEEAQKLLDMPLEEAEKFLQIRFAAFEDAAREKHAAQQEAQELANFVKPEPMDEDLSALNPAPPTSSSSTRTQLIVRGIDLSLKRIDIEQMFQPTAFALITFDDPKVAVRAADEFDGALSLAGRLVSVKQLQEGEPIEQGDLWDGESPSFIPDDKPTSSFLFDDNRREGRLFVSNVNYGVHPNEIITLFGSEVNPELLTIYSLDGHLTGYIVNIAGGNPQEDARKLILKFNTYRWNEKALVVEPWRSHTDKSSPSVFVGNIPSEATLLDIIEFFSPVVVVKPEDVRLRPSHSAGQLGWVTLDSTEVASTCIEQLHRKNLLGRNLIVEPSKVNGNSYADTSPFIPSPSNFPPPPVSSTDGLPTLVNGFHPARMAMLADSTSHAAVSVPQFSPPPPPVTTLNNWSRNGNRSVRDARSFSPPSVHNRNGSTRGRSSSPPPRRSSHGGKSRRFPSRSRSPDSRVRSRTGSVERSSPPPRRRRSSRSRSPDYRHSSGSNKNRRRDDSREPRNAQALSSRSNKVLVPHSSSRSDSVAGTPPDDRSTSTSSLSTQDKLDISRLESLNLSLDDIQAIKKLWEPIVHPPSANFSRTIDLKVTYGWLAPEIARRALNMPTPFPLDETLAGQFETFLKSQTGESRDHYTIFFALLSEWNENINLFTKTAKAAIAAQKKKGPRLESLTEDYDPNGKPLRITERNSSGKKPRKYEHRVKKFEVTSTRIKKAFGLLDKMDVDR